MFKRIFAFLFTLLLALPLAAPAELIMAPDPAELVFIPGSTSTNQSTSYWETPMDITDEAAIWAMLTAPITVVKGNQKKQTLLYSQPDNTSEPVGDITMDSQGLHVLETRNDGWSFVEVYSSSFHDSKIKAWNQLVQGYIRSDLLETKQVDQQYGLVVDKLSQKLYIFEDGKLYDTLAISTGLANDRQPYNETRSGEFLIVSPVGDFVSDNMVGEYALRFNAGDLVHQAPYIKRGDNKNYDITEKVLGERASHGCIRVQRKRTPKGTNMSWLWNTLRKKPHMGATRVVIWEDLRGRQLDIPDAALLLYYNTQGGKNYHIAETCYGVRDKFYPLASFTYGELNEGAYAKLTPCPYCFPPLRAEEIEAINVSYLLQY
ncbi:MAG: L,D-transpeptidase [Clostridiales bacterium]|nr:L,D-transpeptidase [Clostridiales bacterium]